MTNDYHAMRLVKVPTLHIDAVTLVVWAQMTMTLLAHFFQIILNLTHNAQSASDLIHYVSSWQIGSLNIICMA